MKTLVLAHYYTVPEVQKMADYVGDSLELAQISVREKPDRIIFAGVRFMAETAKILNPNAEVILPHPESSCSLVDQVDEEDFLDTIAKLPTDTYVVTYINSSARIKAFSDYIVTSRNVEDIIDSLIKKGHNVFFTPDRNMGAYLAYNNPEWGNKFDYLQDAVCVVHDEFKEQELYNVMKGWSDYPKYLIAHPEAPLPILKKADYVGSTKGMLQWIKNFPYQNGIIYVGTEDGLLYNMKELRPTLDIRLLPTYTGCQCNSCPFMKKNTPELVQSAIDGTSGVKIDYMNAQLIKEAKRSINAMLEFETEKNG